MAHEWELTEPRVLDVGGAGERVQRLTVEVIGGRVDVLTHDDSSAAHLEVAEVQGMPLHVQWDGSHLTVRQERAGANWFDKAKAVFNGMGNNQVVVSISIPAGAEASI